MVMEQVVTKASTKDLTREEAWEVVETINREIAAANRHLDGARRWLFELKRRNGWRALGYPSWRACIIALWGKSRAQVYRQHAAAEFEFTILGGEIGIYPERVIRPLTSLDADLKAGAFQLAQEIAQDVNDGRVTSSITEAVADAIKEALVTGATQDQAGNQTLIKQRLQADAARRLLENMKADLEIVRSRIASAGDGKKRHYLARQIETRVGRVLPDGRVLLRSLSLGEKGGALRPGDRVIVSILADDDDHATPMY